MAPPRLLYAGAGLSGRHTTLQRFLPRVGRMEAVLDGLAAGIDVPLSRGVERVEIAWLYASNRWFDSIEQQSKSDLPDVGASARRVLEWAGSFTGVVLVVDSQEARLLANREVLEKIERIVDLRRAQLVLQLNKRDLPTALDVETLRRELGRPGAICVESIATTGYGVIAAMEAAIHPRPVPPARVNRRVVHASPRALFRAHWPERPIVHDGSIVERLEVSGAGVVTLGGVLAVAAIWPKRILAEAVGRAGAWSVELAVRRLDPGARTVVGARIRCAEPITCELLERSDVGAFRVIVGDATAVHGAEQYAIPEAAYRDAARDGLGRVAGELLIFGIQSEHWTWIGRDARGDVVEIGACDPSAAAMLGGEHAPGRIPL